MLGSLLSITFCPIFVSMRFCHFCLLWVLGNYWSALMYFSKIWFFKNTEVHFRIVFVCIVWFDFECLLSGFEFFLSDMSGLNIGNMEDNQKQLRHDRVSQHASIHMERARPPQSPVGTNSFDAEMLTSRVQVFLASSSRRQVSPATVLGAPTSLSWYTFYRRYDNGTGQRRFLPPLNSNPNSKIISFPVPIPIGDGELKPKPLPNGFILGLVSSSATIYLVKSIFLINMFIFQN